VDSEIAKIIFELETIVRDLAYCIKDLTNEQIKLSSQVNYLWKELAEDFKVDKDRPM